MIGSSGVLTVEPVPGLVVAVSTRQSGDLAVTAVDVDSRRRAITNGLPVSWLHQVHGTDVSVVNGPPGPPAPAADAAVTDVVGVAVSVVTADCAPIALWSDDGVIGVVHAGWRGLLGGIVERGVEAVRRRSRPGTSVHALAGPMIHPECYEFGSADLDLLADVYGPEVRGETVRGMPALDLPAAVASALRRAGADIFLGPGALAFDACTACDDRWFSWRARKDVGRQALFVWRTM